MSGNLITYDHERVLEGIEKCKAGLDLAAQVVRAAIVDVLYRIAQDMMGAAQARLGPQNRSERLSQSAVIAQPDVTASWVIVVAGFQAVYAAFRDQGGTIVPVRADVLAIPQKPILDAHGESIYANPRQEPKLFVLRIPRLNFAGLAMKVNGKLEIHWVFAHSVTQAGSHYFTGTIQERQSQVGAIGARLVKDELVKGAAA